MTVGWRGTHRCVSPFEIQHCWGSEACKGDALQSHRPPVWCASPLCTPTFQSDFSAPSQGSGTRERVSKRTITTIHGGSFNMNFMPVICVLQCLGVSRSTWNRQTSTSSRRRSARQERTTRIRSLKTCFVLGALIGAQMPARWDEDRACYMFQCVCVLAQNTVVCLCYFWGMECFCAVFRSSFLSTLTLVFEKQYSNKLSTSPGKEYA